MPLLLFVALSCCSGTGKTTLAHVLAAHCGFRVVEINASDERTASTLTRRIADAAQMTHVLDGKHAKHAATLVVSMGAAHHNCNRQFTSCRVVLKHQRAKLHASVLQSILHGLC